MTVKEYLEGLIAIYRFMEAQVRQQPGQAYAADIYAMVASDVQSVIDKIDKEAE